MNAVRQSFRPKHQVLVLKCYPKFQKNVVDVKPNSSELSYLLYYATTRRSKVQKVAEFLEKKAGSDVGKGKIGNVQVTLEILRALIEKSPRDLPLYAPYVLRILGLILQSKDLNMVEDSIPTFETFCAHHDVATLAADQGHIQQYEEIVKMYASFTALSPPFQIKGALSAPVAIRWRSAGMQAIKSITASEAIGADGGKQLNIIMPMILQNLYSDTEDYLEKLQEEAQVKENTENDTALRRRMSMATVQTVDTHADTNPAAVLGTTADADRLAEEEVGLLGLESLKQIFVANNRGQIRMATAAMLRFVSSKASHAMMDTSTGMRRRSAATWAATLMEMVTRWAPVQDRFVILVTAMETLVRSPVAEENLEQQLMLFTLVGNLLSSSINMIGLSVMDVLLGLVQHILLLLQLGGKGSSVFPHPQQTDGIDLFRKTNEVIDIPSVTESLHNVGAADVSSPSATRLELLARLQRCIGDLATHIYYSDQISDMITAILLRLKPSQLSGVNTAAEAIEHPAAAAQAISNSVNLQEDPNTDEFFSFGTARVTALQAIREVLTVANMKGSVAGAAVIGRNRVGVQVWEGTQWLLRDEDRRVRRAYVDALLTWLRLEMSRGDLRVLEDKRQMLKGNTKVDAEPGMADSLARRAVSSASQRNKPIKPTKSTFLQLLHLAIYDNALESPESESDILLLHLLLVNLVERLGVNAVKSGLPMIMRLQEDINIDYIVRTPVAKLNIGSLVHGYFWALSQKFEFDSTMVGYQIHSEISRRKKHGLWLNAIQLPPLSLGNIISPATIPLTEKLPLPLVQAESLKPFDACPAMVRQIALCYASSGVSPPTSPPNSPGRVFSMPLMSPSGPSSSEHELPPRFQEAMLFKWTKESCIATAEKESARTASLHGSRTGTNQSGRNYLGPNGHTIGNDSPPGTYSPTTGPNGNNQITSADVLNSSLRPLQQQQYRRSSVQDTGSPTPLSSSEQNPTLRVDDLKRVLAGGALAEAFSRRSNNSAIRGASPLRVSNTAYQDFAHARTGRTGCNSLSTGSDSIVSAQGFESADEGELSRSPTSSQPPHTSSTLAAHYSEELGKRSFEHSPSPARGENRTGSRPGSRPESQDTSKLRPTTSSSASEDPEANARALKGELVPPISRGSGGDGDDEVPPVPPLPPNVSMHNSLNLAGRKSAGQSLNGIVIRPTTAPDGSERMWEKEVSSSELGDSRSSLKAGRRGQGKALDVRQLLKAIEVGDGGIGKGVGRPPY
ncbi:plasma membrane localization protein [Lignoscripta atroalba]|nr:plasma membrane localization protein [Lignoscripta atroalba]